MRTKTLVLTALGSMSALGLMAQTSTNVYSLNAVGYINVSVVPGFNLISDQLWASGGNYISNILSDASGALDGSEVYTFNPATGKFTEDEANSLTSNFANNWNNGGTNLLNPGTGAWFYSTITTNLTFVGTVPQGTNTVPLSQGFNLVSSPVPQTGDLVLTLDLTNETPGDEVFVYNNPGGYSSYVFDPANGEYGYGLNWDKPQGFTSPIPSGTSNTTEVYGDPYVAVGQGFWYYASTAINYTRVFSVND
jgi:hypothetical protein